MGPELAGAGTALALLVLLILAARGRGLGDRSPSPTAPVTHACDHCGRPLDVAVDAMISDEGEFLHHACALVLGRDTRSAEDGEDADCAVCGLQIQEDDDWVWSESTGRARAHASCADSGGP